MIFVLGISATSATFWTLIYISMNLDCFNRFTCQCRRIIKITEKWLRYLRLIINCALKQSMIIKSLITYSNYWLLCWLWTIRIISMLRSHYVWCIWNSTITCIFNSLQIHFLYCRNSILSWDWRIVNSNHNVLLVNSRWVKVSLSWFWSHYFLHLLFTFRILFICKNL